MKSPLFSRGFLLTDQKQDTTVYSFYNNWNEYEIQRHYMYVYKFQKTTAYKDENCSIILVGHAYNLFSMESSEERILEKIAKAEKYIDYITELTGNFF